MPPDQFPPESSVEPQSNSPDTAGGSGRKRRRKVLSCYDCRRRKLQCDRALPACGRCTKAGLAAKCLYLEDATEADSGVYVGADQHYGPLGGHFSRPMQTTANPADLLSRLEYQDRRIKELESALSQQAVGSVQLMKSSKLPLTPESITIGGEVSGREAINDRETMLFRGKSFKTQFFGSTCACSLIGHMPELNNFTKEALQKFPALSRIRQDMGALEDRINCAGSGARSVTDEDLRALLPDKAEADQLVQLYLDNYGSIYHILHLPTFHNEYMQLWIDFSEARPHFVAVVLLMMAAARCVASTQPWLYMANSSTARDKAITAFQTCEGWLQTQSQKHVVVEDFQIRFLILLVKQVSAVKLKRTWTEAGTVMKFYICAGLHRNPGLIRKETSALDKELRRRIWAAMAEFELQTSFDRGMVSTPWPLQADVSPPANIHDDDVDQSSSHLPTARSAQEFTATSYLALSNESLLLRHSLTTLLNNIRQPMSFDQAKRLTEEIEAHLESIPQWIGRSSLAPQALLCLSLYQYLLTLHDRMVRQANSASERNFSRMVILDTARKVIDTHKTVLDKKCYALELLCHDQLRATLSICHVYVNLDPQADQAISQVVENNAVWLMNEAIEMLSDKVIRCGREQRQLWIALASHGFLKTKGDPSKRLTFIQEAVDRIMRPYYKIMASQEEIPADLSTTQKNLDKGSTRGVFEYLPNVEGPPPSELQANDPPLLGLDEIAAWTFEDWTFNPADFQTLEMTPGLMGV